MFDFSGYSTTLLQFDHRFEVFLLFEKQGQFQIYLNEGAHFKSTLKPISNHYYIHKSNADVA